MIALKLWVKAYADGITFFKTPLLAESWMTYSALIHIFYTY